MLWEMGQMSLIPYPVSQRKLISVYYIHPKTMTESQYLEFYNYLGKFREPPVERILGENFKNSEGANGSLLFFFFCIFDGSYYV
jgi:hypothetical protein